MFLEMFHHAFVDVSMLYFYVGLFILTLGVTYISRFVFNHMLASPYEFKNNDRYVKVNPVRIEKPIITNESLMDWFVMTCKRIAEQDDKADDLHSYFNMKFKIRGGQLCLQTTYSHFLKNTVYVS